MRRYEYLSFFANQCERCRCVTPRRKHKGFTFCPIKEKMCSFWMFLYPMEGNPCGSMSVLPPPSHQPCSLGFSFADNVAHRRGKERKNFFYMVGNRRRRRIEISFAPFVEWSMLPPQGLEKDGLASRSFIAFDVTSKGPCW